MSEYAPGIYVKNGRPRTAHTASDAVALVFDGYKRVGDEVPMATEAPSEPVADEESVEEAIVEPVADEESVEESVEEPTIEPVVEKPSLPTGPKPTPPTKNKN